jgi:hypothetical protein
MTNIEYRATRIPYYLGNMVSFCDLEIENGDDPSTTYMNLTDTDGTEIASLKIADESQDELINAFLRVLHRKEGAKVKEVESDE